MAAMSEGFYLCQPAPIRASSPACAACCGIYNYHGHDRDLVTAVLAMQTDLMAVWDGTDADLERTRAEIERRRPRPRFPAVYNCPFAGFYDQARTRVGCLLHPAVRGQELRGYCRYGARTCAEAKCLAYDYLTEPEALALAAAAQDWYIYGLAMTDVAILKDFLSLCQQTSGLPVPLERVAQETAPARALADFLQLLEHWPFPRDPERFGKTYWIDDRHYAWTYQIEYERLGAPQPFHHRLLLALGAVIASRQELQQAIALIDAKAEAFIQAGRCQLQTPLAPGGTGLMTPEGLG
jgi:hypothetical protein